MSTELIDRITIKLLSKKTVCIFPHTAPMTLPLSTLGGVIACPIFMPPRDRKVLTVRLSVCSMSMLSFVGGTKALTVTVMRELPRKPMLSICGILTRSMTVIGRWSRQIKKVYGISLPKRQRNIEPLNGKCVTKCILRLPSNAANMTINTKTEI